MGRTACTEPQYLHKGALYLYLWSWKSRAIPLLPLWTVRPVQSLSACTRVHFTFTFGHERVELYLYSPYGPYGLYRASVPVQVWPLPLLTQIQVLACVNTVKIYALAKFSILEFLQVHRFSVEFYIWSNRHLGVSLNYIFMPSLPSQIPQKPEFIKHSYDLRFYPAVEINHLKTKHICFM